MSDLATLHRVLVRHLARTAPARLADGLGLAELRDTLLPYRRFRNALGVHMEEDYDALLLQLAAGDEGLAQLDDPRVLKLFQAERRSPNPDLTQLEVHGSASLTLDATHVARVLAETPEPPAPPVTPAAPAADRGLVLLDTDADPDPSVLPLDLARAAIAQPASPAAPARPVAVPPPAPGIAARGPAESPVAPRPGAPGAPFAPRTPEPPGVLRFPAAGSVPAEPAAPTCRHCHGALPLGRAVRFCPHCGGGQLVPCRHCGAEAEPGWKHCVNCGSPVGG